MMQPGRSLRHIWFSNHAWGAGGVWRRRVLPQAAWLLLGLIMGFAVVWPVLQLQWRAFADGGAAFARLAELPRIERTVQVTIVLALCSSALAVVLGTLLAWCSSLLPARLRAIGEIAPILPLVVPAVAAVTGWIFLLSPRVGYLNMALRQLPFLSSLEEGPFNIYSVTWIVILTGLLLTAFVYVFVLTALKNMGQELEAAAAASGASPARRFFTVTLPLLRPSIVFSAGVVFLLGLGQFTAPLLLGRTTKIDVLTTEMFYLTMKYPIDFGLGAALGFPILIAGLAVVFLQRLALRDQRRFVVVSAKSRYDMRQTRWWAAVVIGVYLLLTTVLPLAALLYVSVSPFWSGTIQFEVLTLRHWQSVLKNPSLLDAIYTSIKVSLIAIALLIPLGFAMAFALVTANRVSRPIRALIDVIATTPMAVPASLMGFGLLFAYTQPPLQLYGTTAVLVITYVTLDDRSCHSAAADDADVDGLGIPRSIPHLRCRGVAFVLAGAAAHVPQGDLGHGGFDLRALVPRVQRVADGEVGSHAGDRQRHVRRLGRWRLCRGGRSGADHGGGHGGGCGHGPGRGWPRQPEEVVTMIPQARYGLIAA